MLNIHYELLLRRLVNVKESTVTKYYLIYCETKMCHRLRIIQSVEWCFLTRWLDSPRLWDMLKEALGGFILFGER